MSQYQPNAAPGRSFIEKINLKFSNLTVSSATSFTEKDGSTDDDTLIHNAFVAFFDKRNEEYPEWLGAKPRARPNRPYSRDSTETGSTYHPNQRSSQHSADQSHFNPSYQSNQFVPVRAAYNSPQSVPQETSSRLEASHSRLSSGEEKTYTRRSNSRLQEMYNKSRHNSGYNARSLLTQPSGSPAASRSNSAGQRLRDRVLNGDPSANGTRPTWGRQ